MRLGGTYATNRVLTPGLDNMATRRVRPAGTSPHSATKHLPGRGAAYHGRLDRRRGASGIEPPAPARGRAGARPTCAKAARATEQRSWNERSIPFGHDRIRPRLRHEPPVMTQLNNATVSSLSVPGPSYDRSEVSVGIVHFGVGGFHRAHQARYLDALMEQG